MLLRNGPEKNRQAAVAKVARPVIRKKTPDTRFRPTGNRSLRSSKLRFTLSV
ncbi:hypothetical protein RE6C_01493 [Rhodopirellula europaea 6C]|uniref:Uncharacterized protein n=1 Tax=Rhodopirellula europaea 6C TaxID=1263867 RepID=M2AYJ9_9BACT|nr:hypothetical protein RE6C_01493 [Rhodopirellula europaea 6C]